MGYMMSDGVLLWVVAIEYTCTYMKCYYGLLQYQVLLWTVAMGYINLIKFHYDHYYGYMISVEVLL